MFRRRNTRKPPEGLYAAFKDRYAHLNDAAPDTSPITPFPPGPRLSIDATSNPSSTTLTSFTPGPGHDSKDMTPMPFDLPDLDSFEPAHFLDPNHLDSTFGGGFAPSPGAALSASSAAMSASNLFPTTSSLGISSSAAFDHLGLIASQNQSFLPFQQTLGSNNQQSRGMDFGQAYGNYQHYAPHAYHSEPNFNPQQSLIHDDAHRSMMQEQAYNNNSMQQHQYDFAPSQSLKQTSQQQSTAPLTFGQRQQQQFRWHLTLRAHTAMIKNEEDIPMTYLNKRQPYIVLVSDTNPPMTGMAGMVQYRTSIRVCFDEEQQRARPAACWQLFREGRGNQENDARGGGPLQAVEYVNPEQSALSGLRGNASLEKEDFDGFTFTWWPTPTGAAECSVQVRFNFLSTDFSHSKGVKGVPVRLCSKTEMISSASGAHHDPQPERTFCKIKLFRDHGAERKLANDRQHLSKKIEKFQKQLGEDEMKENGKRRRSDSSSSRPAKVLKLSRAWSVSSEGSDGERPAEGELRSQLRNMEAQFATQQDYSLFFLRGEEADDPDLHPIDTSEPLPPIPTLQRMGTTGTTLSTNESPTSSTLSLPPASAREASFRHPTPLNAPSSRHTSRNEATPVSCPPSEPTLARPANPQHLVSPPESVTQIQKIQRNESGESRESREWLDTLDADASYQPPPPPSNRPVACFYVKASIPGVTQHDEYYRAVYLRQRTREEFITRIGRKCGVQASAIDDVVRVTNDGLHVLVDDDLIREMPEGQDMHADFDLADDDPITFTSDDLSNTDRYKLKLRY